MQGISLELTIAKIPVSRKRLSSIVAGNVTLQCD